MTTKWILPSPRPVARELKPPSSANMMSNILNDGRLELTIAHDVLRGVTPAMLKWCFGNIVGSMEYMGQVYPRYLVWHPLDHIHYEVVRPGMEEWTWVPAGTQYFTRMVWGSTTWFGRLAFNRLIRPRIFSNDMARAWLRHHVGEIGNLENFFTSPVCKTWLVVCTLAQKTINERWKESW